MSKQAVFVRKSEPINKMSPFQRCYRLYREELQLPAADAVRFARNDLKLSELCDGDYRVRWEYDQDFELDWDFPSLKDEEEVRRQLREGELEALGVILERRHICDRCDHETWEHVDSLWGIVLGPDDHAMRRYHEVSLDF